MEFSSHVGIEIGETLDFKLFFAEQLRQQHILIMYCQLGVSTSLFIHERLYLFEFGAVLKFLLANLAKNILQIRVGKGVIDPSRVLVIKTKILINKLAKKYFVGFNM
jgi:hypothetical protein